MKEEITAAEYKLDKWEKFERKLSKGQNQSEIESKMRALILNGHDLLVSHDKDKLKKLKLELTFGDLFSSSLFKDKEIPYLAASLYQQKFLTWTEFTTLLELHQATLLPPELPRTVTKSSYVFFKKEEKIQPPLVRVYKIIDVKGKFTPEAEHYLLKEFKSHYYYRHLTEEQLNNWKQSLLYYQKSQKTNLNNLFYVHSSSPQELEFDVMIRGLKQHMIKPSHQVVRLASFANHLLGLTAFGNDYKPAIPTIGDKTPLEIEASVMLDYRSSAIYFPGYGIKNVHNCNFSYLSATLHDEYHAKILTLLKDYIKVHIYIVNFIREKFLKKLNLKKSYKNSFTKEIWSLIDSDVPMLLTKIFTSLRNEDIFSSLYFTKFETIFHRHTEFKKDDIEAMTYITDLGISILVDMVTNPKSWEELDFKRENLKGLAKEHFELISQFDFWNDNVEENIIGYRLILDILQRMDIAEIDKSRIHEFVPNISSELKHLSDECHLVKDKQTNLLSLIPKNGMSLELFINKHSLAIVQDNMLIPAQRFVVSV